MGPSCLQRLRSADHPTYWECPRTFPRKKEIRRIRELQPLLEAIVGARMELDENVEDASYFAELSWQTPPGPVPGVGARVILTYVAVRFSALGRLATVWGCVPERPVERALEQKLATLLEAHGYLFVPRAFLEEPYDGVNRFAPQIRDWWCRFFDYC